MTKIRYTQNGFRLQGSLICRSGCLSTWVSNLPSTQILTLSTSSYLQHLVITPHIHHISKPVDPTFKIFHTLRAFAWTDSSLRMLLLGFLHGSYPHFFQALTPAGLSRVAFLTVLSLCIYLRGTRHYLI